MFTQEVSLVILPSAGRQPDWLSLAQACYRAEVGGRADTIDVQALVQIKPEPGQPLCLFLCMVPELEGLPSSFPPFSCSSAWF